ncbi:MAG: 2-(1,2-epoxy-1,2-dihydrophenyl)acetyl-CoA isomerase [Dehalococcoidia bacterium]|nr:2-(1,2-epoxy-1,2-dihydrophenyl)acetyl-CoA isomerase [Dehalococcoidia bacterium]
MQTGTFHGIEVTTPEKGVALITLNRPEQLNGMNHEMKRDLVELLLQAQMDDAICVVVFTGNGRAFSAGDDITGRPPSWDGAEELVPGIPPGHNHFIGTYNGLRGLSQPVNLAVRNLDKVSIAAVNGVAIQSGFSLALSSDFRIASSTARLGSGTLRFGLLPDEAGHYLVVQMLGVARAMDFFMRNRIVSAAEAADLGLVHEVVEPERLLDRSLELAVELAAGPQVAQRLLKRAIYNAAEMTMHQALDDIATKTAISDWDPDAIEGMKAFKEKRAPQFGSTAP